MNIEAAQAIAGAVARMQQMDRRLTELDELDSNNSRNVPGFFGGETEEPFSAETARKIRAVIKDEIAVRHKSTRDELSKLGVDFKEPTPAKL